MSLRTALREVGTCLRHGVDGKVHVLSCRSVSRNAQPKAVCGLAAAVWLATDANAIDCVPCERWAERFKASETVLHEKKLAARALRALRAPKPPPKPAPPDYRRCAAGCGEAGPFVRRPDPTGAPRWWHFACWSALQAHHQSTDTKGKDAPR